MSRVARVIAGIVAMQILSVTPADACRCATPGTACEAFGAADVVFVGQVLTIENAPPGDGDERAPAVHFAVVESFRGVTTPAVTILNNAGSCAASFTIGETYLVYAHQRDASEPPSTSMCTRTARLRIAQEDIEYARSMAAVVPGTPVRVRGSVRRIDRDPLSGTTTTVALRGIPVIATGEGGSFRAITGFSGEFSIAGLPPGVYAITADVPGTLKPGPPRKVDLRDPRGCGAVDLWAEYDGRVYGRAVDGRGNPVPGLAVELLPQKLGGKYSEYMRVQARTDSEGRFEFRMVPPGAFVVAFDRYFAAAPFDPSRAITVGPGERTVAPDFVVPDGVRLVTVTATVLDETGRRVANAGVSLRDNTEGPNTIGPSLATGGNGTFTMTLVDGTRYELFIRRPVHDANGRERPPQVTTHAFRATAASPSLVVRLRPIDPAPRR